MEKKIEFEKVVRALKLCGQEYHATSCEECPYKKHCLPGDNTPLLEDAVTMLLVMQEDLLSFLNEIERIQEKAAATSKGATALYDNGYSNGILHGWLRFQPEKGAAE